MGFVNETGVEMIILKGTHFMVLTVNHFSSKVNSCMLAWHSVARDILILLFIIHKRLMTYLGNHMLTGFVVICLFFSMSSLRVKKLG